MPVLSRSAFGVAEARMVQILPPGTSGTPVQPGVELKVVVTPDAARGQGVTLTDSFVVVAHVPKPGASNPAEPEWQRVMLRPESPVKPVVLEADEEPVAVGGARVFHAEDIPVDAAAAALVGVWFSIEKAPHVTITQRPNFLGIDTTPGDVLAWGQGFGDNVRPTR